MNISTLSRRTRLVATIAITAAVAGGAVTVQAHGDDAPQAGRLTGAQRQVIREATRAFRDVDAAIDAGYLPTDTCAALPGVGGMGYHFINPALAADDRIDPTQPELLLYRKDDKGRFVLAGVEWFKADADQDPSTTGDRPTLFGHQFDGPMPGHEPGMPMHYDLHVWTELKNPAGELSAWNPRLVCP